MAASSSTACGWADALVSLLLEALRPRENLWNSRSKNYKNRNTKKKEYEEILAILRGDRPDVDLPAIKSKANVSSSGFRHLALYPSLPWTSLLREIIY